jgi:hypothetical protein
MVLSRIQGLSISTGNSHHLELGQHTCPLTIDESEMQLDIEGEWPWESISNLRNMGATVNLEVGCIVRMPTAFCVTMARIQ